MNKVAKSRVFDYAIYIACGLLLSAVAYIPVYLGVDIRPMIPKAEATAVCVAIVGFLGYELREWVKLPSFWMYLGVIILIQASLLWWVTSHGITLSVLFWVLLSSAEVYGFSVVFRVVTRRSRNSPK